ncbi:MAG: bifunctional 4-hydroxy-2-oxoglutarate aldolase/2-dehydro-3-deoxy-phosphogluconate aldolase [Candidatus Omnitrophota bacterium]
MDVGQFSELPLMGIVRGVDPGDIEPLLEAVIGAGLKTIEITMNTPGAAGIISKAKSVAGDRIDIGAGTVLSKKDLNEALDAGASFVVMPAFIEEIVTTCVDKKVPVFPGAFTPREVLDSWNAGASMVKVFPSSMFGPRYIKELKGPYDGIKLMAVGGVRLENVDEYFSCGADAVAFGGSVFRKEWLDAKDFASIEKLVGQYVTLVRKAAK